MLPDRVERYVQRTPGCWFWRGNIDSHTGYPRMRLDGRRWRAHRLVYQLLVGPIPQGLALDHLCRVRHCVNPAHLEPVTPGENVLRGEGITARHARKDECHRGHPYATDGYRDAGGRRRCRTCHRKPFRDWRREPSLSAEAKRTRRLSLAVRPAPRGDE